MQIAFCPMLNLMPNENCQGGEERLMVCRQNRSDRSINRVSYHKLISHLPANRWSTEGAEIKKRERESEEKSKAAVCERVVKKKDLHNFSDAKCEY